MQHVSICNRTMLFADRSNYAFGLSVSHSTVSRSLHDLASTASIAIQKLAESHFLELCCDNTNKAIHLLVQGFTSFHIDGTHAHTFTIPTSHRPTDDDTNHPFKPELYARHKAAGTRKGLTSGHMAERESAGAKNLASRYALHAVIALLEHVEHPVLWKAARARWSQEPFQVRVAPREKARNLPMRTSSINEADMRGQVSVFHEYIMKG